MHSKLGVSGYHEQRCYNCLRLCVLHTALSSRVSLCVDSAWEDTRAFPLTGHTRCSQRSGLHSCSCVPRQHLTSLDSHVCPPGGWQRPAVTLKARDCCVQTSPRSPRECVFQFLVHFPAGPCLCARSCFCGAGQSFASLHGRCLPELAFHFLHSVDEPKFILLFRDRMGQRFP